jgi:hypothetical protein
MEYSIPAVPPSMVMDVCKFTASATSSISRENLISCFENQFDRGYINRAIQASFQLKLLEEIGSDELRCSQRWKEDIKKANRSQLNLPFRDALQDYPPFIVFVDLLSKGYLSNEAAAAVHGVFSVQTSPKIIEQSLRTWGIYSGTIEQDLKTKRLTLTIDVEHLTADYVKNLLESLTSDFKAKIFMVDRLTNELYAYLTRNDLDIRELVNALRNYEKDPAESVNKSAKVLEAFLYKIGQDNALPVTTCKGLTELADALRQKNPPMILKNQRNICQGIGGVRNIASHGIDAETGKCWKINGDAALASIMLTPVLMRSIYTLINTGEQEL